MSTGLKVLAGFSRRVELGTTTARDLTDDQLDNWVASFPIEPSQTG